MPVHGFVGLAVIGVAETLLFGGHRLTGEWFTPIVWTGYILFVDGLVAWRMGGSPLTTSRGELCLMALASVGCWWLFELYNAPRFWRGGEEIKGLWWQYHNLEPNLFLRRVAYDWAFATIFPALFLTSEYLKANLSRGLMGRRPFRLPAGWRRAFIAAGGVSVVLPLQFVSAWLVPLVWAGYALLLEPVNYGRGARSWLREAERGDYRTLASLLGSGLVCGFLWEFWNYWALTKWTYTVPYWSNAKLFEMPILGYLGFPAFALEAFAMYHFLCSLLGEKKKCA